MDCLLEPRVRRLVAERLGVDFDDLTPESKGDEAEVRPAMEPIRVWARVVAPAGVGGVLECAESLTPYAIETIIEHALRAGRGAQLEITVAEHGGDAGLRQVQQQFAWLRGRGVAVDVHRSRGRRVSRAA